ncbi:MAG: MBL fold metallo-hydrolase [Thermodesulfobacteriota bacterium]
MQKVTRIPLRHTNVWAVRENGGVLLVDAGRPGDARRLIAALEARGISVSELRAIVLTHAHFDHVGSAAALQKAAGAAVVAPALWADLLAKGDWVLPEGRFTAARAVIALARRVEKPLKKATRYRPVTPDVAVSNDLSLAPYGFSAQVIPTPGHTPDSVSVLTEDGHAFVGDLCYNELPQVFKTRHPPFLMNLGEMHRSWDLLLSRGARTIHPGHGRAFDADELKRKN